MLSVGVVATPWFQLDLVFGHLIGQQLWLILGPSGNLVSGPWSCVWRSALHGKCFEDGPYEEYFWHSLQMATTADTLPATKCQLHGNCWGPFQWWLVPIVVDRRYHRWIGWRAIGCSVHYARENPSQIPLPPESAGGHQQNVSWMWLCGV